MKPLKNMKIVGYRFGQKTFYNDFHIGTDYGLLGDIIYAPFNGLATKTYGPSGGNTILFKADNGKLYRFLHCKQILKTGRVNEGDQIGIVGNTGVSTKPHTHIDISKNGKLELNNRNNFLDPEKENWETLTKTFMEITIVNNTNRVFDLAGLKTFFLTQFEGKFEPVFNEVKTSYTNIPGTTFNGSGCIDIDWYRANVTPLATGQGTLFICESTDYPSNNSWGFASWGDPNKPTRAEMSISDIDMWAFNDKAYHEICHSLQFLTGQPDRTHELLNTSPQKHKELAQYIDQVKLQAKLLTIKPNNPMIIYKFDDNGTQYVLTDDGTLIGIASGAALTKVLANRPQKLVTIPASQRGNFTISTAAIN